MLVRPLVMAAALGCSVDTLRRYRKDGILTARSVFKGKRLVRYDPDKVRAELDAHFLDQVEQGMFTNREASA